MGVPCLDILEKGGGIHATVRAVREATRKQLAAGLRERLDRMLQGGTLVERVVCGGRVLA